MTAGWNWSTGQRRTGCHFSRHVRGWRNLPDALVLDFAGEPMLPPAPSHRILIVTDAWLPQVNGVVRTLTTVAEELRIWATWSR